VAGDQQLDASELPERELHLDGPVLADAERLESVSARVWARIGGGARRG
jgi:hypothetical protein